jgi:flagellar biosynthesis protein FlhB
MAEETGQERTEQPTARRLEQAREEGRVPRSTELSAATAMLAGAVLLGAAGGRALSDFATALFRESTRSLSAGALDTQGAIEVLRSVTRGLVLALLPVVGGVAVLVLGVNLAQTRGLLTFKPIEPKLGGMDPLKGLQRMVSPEAWFNLIKSIAKIAVLAIVTALTVRRAWPELVSLAETGPASIAAVLRDLAMHLVIVVGLSFLALALVDYAFVRWRHRQSLKMTRQEIVYEHRDTEGDPIVKARQRSLAQQKARQRMLQAVPKADVVVVNPTHVAVALRYDPSEAPAPIVVAKGERKLAERIKALALQSRVPVVENRPVARALLATAKVGRMIPPALYAAVAEILAFVYRQRAAEAGVPLPAREARP